MDWCFCGPTCTALKMSSRSKIDFFKQKKVLVLFSASVKRLGVSRMRDFYVRNAKNVSGAQFKTYDSFGSSYILGDLVGARVYSGYSRRII